MTNSIIQECGILAVGDFILADVIVVLRRGQFCFGDAAKVFPVPSVVNIRLIVNKYRFDLNICNAIINCE